MVHWNCFFAVEIQGMDCYWSEVSSNWVCQGWQKKDCLFLFAPRTQSDGRAGQELLLQTVDPEVCLFQGLCWFLDWAAWTNYFLCNPQSQLISHVFLIVKLFKPLWSGWKTWLDKVIFSFKILALFCAFNCSHSIREDSGAFCSQQLQAVGCWDCMK